MNMYGVRQLALHTLHFPSFDTYLVMARDSNLGFTVSPSLTWIKLDDLNGSGSYDSPPLS